MSKVEGAKRMYREFSARIVHDRNTLEHMSSNGQVSLAHYNALCAQVDEMEAIVEGLKMFLEAHGEKV